MVNTVRSNGIASRAWVVHDSCCRRDSDSEKVSIIIGFLEKTNGWKRTDDRIEKAGNRICKFGGRVVVSEGYVDLRSVMVVGSLIKRNFPQVRIKATRLKVWERA